MITFAEFFGTMLPLAGMILIFFLRAEHRMTAMEVKLDLHLKNDCDAAKATIPPL